MCIRDSLKGHNVSHANNKTKRNEHAFCLFHEKAGLDSGYCRSIDLTPEFKRQQVAKYDAIKNCLKTGHAADVCEKKRQCIIIGCQEKHHGNLHNRKDFQNALLLLKEEKDKDSSSKKNNQNAGKTPKGNAKKQQKPKPE